MEIPVDEKNFHNFQNMEKLEIIKKRGKEMDKIKVYRQIMGELENAHTRQRKAEIQMAFIEKQIAGMNKAIEQGNHGLAASMKDDIVWMQEIMRRGIYNEK